MTVNRDRGRDDAKPDPFQSRGFVEVRGELFENGTERHELVMIGGGELAEPKGLDQLVQFFRQLPRGTLGTSELRVRGAAVGGPSEQFMRADDHLQRLAQIVAGHRQ